MSSSLIAPVQKQVKYLPAPLSVEHVGIGLYKQCLYLTIGCMHFIVFNIICKLYHYELKFWWCYNANFVLILCRTMFVWWKCGGMNIRTTFMPAVLKLSLWPTEISVRWNNSGTVATTKYWDVILLLYHFFRLCVITLS